MMSSCQKRAWSIAAIAIAHLAFMCPEKASAQNPAEAFSVFSKGSSVTVDHSKWSRLLGAYVAPGSDGLNRVDYARFKREAHGELKAYIKSLEAVAPQALDRSEQFAYWANLYNAKTVDIVLEKYPLKSIKDIRLGGGVVAAVTGGPWKAKVVNVSGMELSLDDIEHGILRPVFKDPRVHYAVNCASFSCPNLGREAFTGNNLEAQLESAAKDYVNSPRGAKAGGGELVVSSIYSWYQEDFGSDEAGVIAHLKRYAEPALKSKLESITGIADYEYDWGLNDRER